MVKFRVLLCLLCMVPISNEATAGALSKAVKAILESTIKKIPKSGRRQSPLGGHAPTLLKHPLKKAIQHYSCPSMNLRVSLPQLNIHVTVPNNLNIRSGPGTNYQRQARFNEAGAYMVDLLKSEGCWVQVRYEGQGSKKDTGWVYSKLLKFKFDDHLTKPRNRLSRVLGGDGVFKIVSNSTYKVRTRSAQGTAVAISPTVLLTNCHVLGKYRNVQIMENGRGHEAVLIHDDYSEDKCFIRSLVLKVRPVANVQDFKNIQQGEEAYSIGAPLGYNRSIAKGVISGKHIGKKSRYVQTTASISPGSSGGGLFDNKGNLLGITTFTDTRGQNLNFAIAAEDFWR
jgi:S1-C subfamily serine protease